MTYNIRLGLQLEVEAIAEIISRAEPDLVALQEVGRHWTMGPSGDTTERLAHAVGLDHFQYVPSIEYVGPAQYGHALLSRWPIEAARIHRLIRDTDEPRTALQARIAAETPFSILSTHLSHVDDRHAQGFELQGIAGDLGPRALILGDLNEHNTQVPWLESLLAEFEDASTSDAYTFPSGAPERRIDYMLARGGTWSDGRVLDEVDASDHRPVVADLRWTI